MNLFIDNFSVLYVKYTVLCVSQTINPFHIFVSPKFFEIYIGGFNIIIHDI